MHRANYGHYRHPKSKGWLLHLAAMLMLFVYVKGAGVDTPKLDLEEGSGNVEVSSQTKGVYYIINLNR